MLKSIEGVYRDGKIELAEEPTNIPDQTRVIVTFMDSAPIDLRALGISESEAAALRERLQAFAEEWNSPEMDLYDNYEANVHRQTR